MPAVGTAVRLSIELGGDQVALSHALNVAWLGYGLVCQKDVAQGVTLCPRIQWLEG
jgi:hypothetical protein